MIHSYARVSTRKQAHANDCKLQRAAIARWAAGEGVTIAPENHHEDNGVSGKFMTRPAWDALMQSVQGGDCIVAYDLSRCARNLLGLLEWVKEMREKGVRVVFVKDKIDLDTPVGNLMLGVLGALAQWQREMGAARVKEGMQAGKARGAVYGRKPKLTPEQIEQGRAMLKAGDTYQTVAKALGIHRNSVSAYFGPHHRHATKPRVASVAVAGAETPAA